MPDAMFVLLEQPAHVEARRAEFWECAREYYRMAEGESDELERLELALLGDEYVKWALAIADEWLPQW